MFNIEERETALDIHHWRNQVLAAIFLTVCVLGLIAAAISVAYSFSLGLWSIVAADASALGAVLALWRWRGLAYRTRALGLLAVLFCLGVLLVATVGLPTQIYLLAVPLLTAVLLGLRPALVAIVLTTGTLVAIGFMAMPTRPPLADNLTSGTMASWLVISVNYLFVAVLVTLPTALTLHWLEELFQREQSIAKSLADGQARLRAANESIHHLAYYDALTDLPNRRWLMDRLHSALAEARASGERGGLLYIDLDNFKTVNDARGHAIGDVLLLQAAMRLGEDVGDAGEVARLGGDEFIVLIPDGKRALPLAWHLRNVMAAPFQIDAQTFTTGASIGVTLFDGVDQSADDVLREADTAMYRAKAMGRNRVVVFEASMRRAAEAQLSFEHDLARAIGAQELSVVVQPQRDANGNDVGAELLSRWCHPVRGNVPPTEFIAAAEASGLIIALGDWVIEQGCATLRAMRERGSQAALSINVSAMQFRQPDFTARLIATLERSGAPADGLILEVTESLFIDDIGDTVERMHELTQRGIRFSIDDFGTGYSSLSYLKRLPLYELKIDRSFVDGAGTDAHDTAIVRMIVSMAKTLGLRIVAEGVETQAQADYLYAQGCDAVQGYWHARPAPLDDWLSPRL